MEVYCLIILVMPKNKWSSVEDEKMVFTGWKGYFWHTLEERGEKRSMPEQAVWTLAPRQPYWLGKCVLLSLFCWWGNGSALQWRTSPFRGIEHLWFLLGSVGIAAAQCPRKTERGCKLGMSDHWNRMFSLHLLLHFRHRDILSSIATGKVSKHENCLLQILLFLPYLPLDNYWKIKGCFGVVVFVCFGVLFLGWLFVVGVLFFLIVFSHTVCHFTLAHFWPFPAWHWANRLLGLVGKTLNRLKGCVEELVCLVFLDPWFKFLTLGRLLLFSELPNGRSVVYPSDCLDCRSCLLFLIVPWKSVCSSPSLSWL